VIQGVTSNPHFSNKQILGKVKQILDDELTIKSLKLEKSNSLAFSVLFVPMKYKWYRCSVVFGKVLGILQTKFYLQFQKVRVNLTTKKVKK